LSGAGVAERLLAPGAGVIFNIRDADELIAVYDLATGRCPHCRGWFQAVLFLMLADVVSYRLHRMFHGGGFWKYHAIHHSSEDLDWISAARLHPVNLLPGTIAAGVILPAHSFRR
jgi:sterol desaturase/sphingolipid hydroxylase (fatty acid hydroxylase superfamily)